jgi:hypothetical protein
MPRPLTFLDSGDRNDLPGSIDDEIGALLLAIEEEPVPARLRVLAVKLQKALVDRRNQKQDR